MSFGRDSEAVLPGAGSDLLSPRYPTSPHLGSASNVTVAEEVLSNNAVDEVLNQCPKFRVLVLGKSGAGKSSLINSIFNVDTANVSHEQAGAADINFEITSEQNNRFIVHDSQGFAHGEAENYQRVERFIRERTDSNKPLKDRLHAIWFCVEILVANSALLEKGEEKIFQMELENGTSSFIRASKCLIQLPIIVAFTKYDALVSKVENEIESRVEGEEGLDVDDEQFEKLVEEQARKEFSTICVAPLRTTSGNRFLSFVEVSTRTRYRKTLERLMQLTRAQVDEAVWLTWAIAQNTSASLKIDASIAIGRKKYWKGLAHGMGRHNLKEFIRVIHDEIVTIWNFNDPYMHCNSPDFKAALSRLVQDLSDEVPREPLGRLITIVDAIATSNMPLALEIGLPISAGLSFAQWVYMTYRRSPTVIRVLMGYIIDLALVMQSLFWIVQARGEGQRVTKHLLRLAFEAYEASEGGERAWIHNAIAAFVTPSSLLRFGQKDLVLEKVETLITQNRFKPPQSLRDRVKALPESLLNEPERWSFVAPAGDVGHQSDRHS
ncbi:hypothetical protein V5O48_008537 [Marasmius crinis-equi]|uniref:G domain-containing protein n=1 Tax=Marasmius crinis-equi TaxID=585013 RepID=A0ABR3FDL2_9AGAR